MLNYNEHIEKMREEEMLEESNEISLSEIFAIIKKGFWFLVGITLLGGLALGIYAFGIAKPKYKSTGSLMVQVKKETAGEVGFDAIGSKQRLESIMDILLNLEVIHEKTSNNLKPNYMIDATNIKNNMNVSNNKDSLVIFVSYTSTNKDEAFAVAGTIVDTLIDYGNDPANNINLVFDSSLAKLDVSKAKYVSPNKPLLILVGMILGGTVGLIMLFSYEMINAGYKTKEELELATKVQVLGVIPEFGLKRGVKDEK